MMRAVGVVCLLIFSVAFNAPLSAQTSTGGAVRGHVKDEQEAVLQGARVMATSPDAPTPFEVTSDQEGYYRLLNLPPGEYTITAELEGFAKWVREGIVVRAGLNITVPVVMKLGTVTETVAVTVESPLLESSRPIQAVNISGELQRSLPLSTRRQWSDALSLVPGIVSQQALGDTSGNFFLRGADFGSLVISVDGADLASAQQASQLYVKLNPDVLSDIQVTTGAAEASTPLGQGAVVNMVTRSGTNKLKGAASAAWQPFEWNDRNFPGGTSTVSRILPSDFSLGGPILRDRLWFFGAYRYADNRIGISRTPVQLSTLRSLLPSYEPFDGLTRAHYTFAKISGRLSPNHQLHAFYQYDQSPERSGAPNAERAFNETAIGGDGASVRLSSTWGTSVTSQVGVAYNGKSFRVDAVRSDVPSRPVHQRVFASGGRLLGTGAIAILDNNELTNTSPHSKLTLNADISIYRRGPGGTHDFQLGVLAQPRIRARTERRLNNGGFSLEELVLRDPNNLAGGTLPFHRRNYERASATTLQVDSQDFGLYVQDAWRPASRLTVSAGVRVDFINRTDKLFDVRLQRSTAVGPRVGANYVLTADERNTLRASYGRVHDVLSINTISAGTNTVTFVDQYDTNLDGVFETSLSTPGAATAARDRIIDDTRGHPYMNEWTAGYRRQLAGRVIVDAGIVRREYRDRMALVEQNGIYENGVFRGYRDESQNDIYRITSNEWNWPVYNGLELMAARQGGRFQAIASFTRQWRHLAGTWVPQDPASFIQPDAFPNSHGIGDVRVANVASEANSLSGSTSVGARQWRDNVFRVAAVHEMPLGFALSMNYTYQSGLWSGPVVTRIAAPDPRFGPPTVRLSNGRDVSNPLATTLRFAFPTRGDGQFKTSPVHILNARISRRFHVHVGDLELAADGFNLTNSDADQTLFCQE